MPAMSFEERGALHGALSIKTHLGCGQRLVWVSETEIPSPSPPPPLPRTARVTVGGAPLWTGARFRQGTLVVRPRTVWVWSLRVDERWRDSGATEQPLAFPFGRTPGSQGRFSGRASRAQEDCVLRERRLLLRSFLTHFCEAHK